MAIAFIDKATTASEGIPTYTVTLPAAPLAGDLLVASGGLRGVGATDLTGTGWTTLPSVLAAPSGDSEALAWRVAQAGDPAACVFSYGTAQGRVSVAQFRGIPGAVVDVTGSAAGSSGAASVSINPTDGPDVLLIASCSLNVGGLNQYTPANGETELYDLLCSSNFEPCVWLAYKIVSPSTGVYPLGATLANSAPWGIRGVAFRAGAAAGPSGFFGGLDGGAW